MKAAEMGNVSERWRGYTIDEIQYQKALSLLKLEIQKERLAAAKNNLVAPLSYNKWGKVISSANSYRNIVTYAFAGYKLYSAICRWRNKFKRKNS